MHRDIHHFVVSVTCFAVAVGVFFFVGGALKGTKLLRNLVYSIGIIVSNVPEGLLATVTVSLTASARRMSRRNVLVCPSMFLRSFVVEIWNFSGVGADICFVFASCHV